MYNGCLRRGVFSARLKRAKLIPITKLGKENSEDVSKFRPISLLNIAGKVLEKVLINKINHRVFSHDLMNNNRYGFTPQRGTLDAAMAVKDFVEKAAGEIVVLVSIHVKGATFDPAWWPTILNDLKTGGCPKNLYNLTKRYFSQRTNNVKAWLHMRVNFASPIESI